MDDLMKRTVHELSQRERDLAVAAFKRAHDAEPEWNCPNDRAWLEGFAAGRVSSGEEVADLRNVVQAACTPGGLGAMARAWAKYFPDHPISIHGVRVDAELQGQSNLGSVPERLNGDALRSGREAGCKQKGPVARAADTGSFVGSNPTAAISQPPAACDDCAGTGKYSDGLPCDECKGVGTAGLQCEHGVPARYACNVCDSSPVALGVQTDGGKNHA